MDMGLQILAQETFNVEAALFYLFAAISAVSAMGVVASRNIVRMAVWLLFTLGGVATFLTMIYVLLDHPAGTTLIGASVRRRSNGRSRQRGQRVAAAASRP